MCLVKISDCTFCLEIRDGFIGTNIVILCPDFDKVKCGFSCLPFVPFIVHCNV
jgi:hypothetical protein